jgi:hypothetical protein
VQVRVHNHREQRPIYLPPAFQQRREERPGPQLGDPQLQVTSRAGQGPQPVPVPDAGPRACPLVRQRADHRAQLCLDQRLVNRLGRLPDLVVNLGGLYYLQNLQQCRLVQGLRAEGAPSGPATYTTRKGRHLYTALTRQRTRSSSCTTAPLAISAILRNRRVL